MNKHKTGETSAHPSLTFAGEPWGAETNPNELPTV